MRALANDYGLTVTHAGIKLTATRNNGELLELSSAPIDGDGKVIAQVAGRPAGLLFGLETSLHPFKMHSHTSHWLRNALIRNSWRNFPNQR